MTKEKRLHWSLFRILGAAFLIALFSACAPQEPLPTLQPTHTDAPPLPTHTPTPPFRPFHIWMNGDVVWDCYSEIEDFFSGSLPVVVLERYTDYRVWDDATIAGDGYTAILVQAGHAPALDCWVVLVLTPTNVPPTFTPLPTDEPIPVTAEPTTMLVKVNVSKLVLRQVCYNVNGYIYNLKGFPVISDCVYPIKGAIAERIKYYGGNRIEVELYGNMIYANVHGGFYNLKPTIKADGGVSYYVATQRGADGELLFVEAWKVSVVK